MRSCIENVIIVVSDTYNLGIKVGIFVFEQRDEPNLYRENDIHILITHFVSNFVVLENSAEIFIVVRLDEQSNVTVTSSFVKDD